MLANFHHIHPFGGSSCSMLPTRIGNKKISNNDDRCYMCAILSRRVKIHSELPTKCENLIHCYDFNCISFPNNIWPQSFNSKNKALEYWIIIFYWSGWATQWASETSSTSRLRIGACLVTGFFTRSRPSADVAMSENSNTEESSSKPKIS